MAAFFALLAGLAIGAIGGVIFMGVMIGSSDAFRKFIEDLCHRVELDLDI